MITRRQNTEFGIVLTLVMLVANLFIKETTILYKLAILFLLLTALFPSVYTPFTRIWHEISKVIEIFFSTLLLTVLFYFVVTPIGLIRRWMGKDSLQIRKFKKETNSVFITQNKKYSVEDLENQF